MARREARLKTRIWDDTDFLALPGPEQLAYLFLISQPDISHNGVLPLRLKRWAKKLKYRPEQLEKVLVNLENAHFVIVDDDEEELLVRTFIRNDEVFKQPKVLLAASRQLDEIASSKLRSALAAEIGRVLREGLAGENTRPTLLRMLNILGADTTDPVKAQVNTLSDTHSEGYLEGHAEGDTEGHPVPDAMGTGVGEGEGEGFKTVGGSSSSPSGEAEKKPKTNPKNRGTRLPDDFTVTPDMTDWAKRKHPWAFAEIDYHTEQFVAYWKARTGQIAIKLDWKATWESWIRKANRDAEEFARRRGDDKPRVLDADAERCDQHPRQPRDHCQICDSERRGSQ